MKTWLQVLGIIEFVVGLLVLLFLVLVSFVIVRNRHIEFNKLWRSRLFLTCSAFVWVVFLLLGNEYLWNSTDGIFNINPDHSKAVCSLHVFFTVGSSEPLFFLIFLFILKSKTSDKNQNLYINDPNYYVYKWSLLWTIPLILIHLMILILDASSVNEPKKLFWTVYDKENFKCAVPIISTASFAIFFVLFLLIFVFLSRKFSKTIINRVLINRMRLLQFTFISFLPLEVAIRVVLIFTLDIGETSIALFHAFFFVDIAVILIGILEFAFFPVIDSLGFGLFESVLKSLGERDKDYIGMNSTTTISTHSSTPNTLIPISEYEKAIKYMDTPTPGMEGADSGKNPSPAPAAAATTTNNNNRANVVVGDIEMDKLNIKHKSPILDRVRDTEPTHVPPLPLSSPLGSSPSSTLSSPRSDISHEKKKSRRFSLASIAGKSKKSPPSSPPITGMSPPQSSVKSIFQPTPVDDFKGQLFKYTQSSYK
ncbi:hypothetical protein CYY_004464 [Polysphondylium violaceum]|uniref:Uncharacterized protein n=1 Tax=Polysphondylium violaceum TaxID=133409 RepID=A0A8J4V0B7_9MYCE|nr:hypothetical protein CYY_004464 [Polysphondylium violaceum]